MANKVGLRNTTIYNPASSTLSYETLMNAGRWYPTVTALPNREMLVIAGSINTTTQNDLPQVWSPTTKTYRNLTGARKSLKYYPRLHIAPNGKVFKTGPEKETGYLDTSGTGQWDLRIYSNSTATRVNGSSVMYLPGKILSVGGGDPGLNLAEIIDLNSSNPTWQKVTSMFYNRRYLNATLLPDLSVLVSGGTTTGNSLTNAILTPELWNPATKAFTKMAAMQVKRVYHSTALLLPDGTILHLGGNNDLGGVEEYRAEIFYPPYLFKGSRAVITEIPSSAGYSRKITVKTPKNDRIARVTLVRLGSVTHAIDMNQRGNELTFARKAGSITDLEVTTPANANVCPPGHYMLFLITGKGVPSTGKVIRIS
jgi:hypothetical protein